MAPAGLLAAARCSPLVACRRPLCKCAWITQSRCARDVQDIDIDASMSRSVSGEFRAASEALKRSIASNVVAGASPAAAVAVRMH